MTLATERPQDEVLRQHKGQPVILFAEIHSLSDVVLEAAVAVAEQTGKPLGLEAVFPSHMPYIEAYRRKEISKEGFLSVFTDQTEAAAQKGTPDDYLGKARAKRKWETFADAITRGVEIAPLGTSLSDRQDRPNTLEQAEIFDRIHYLSAVLDLKKLANMRDNPVLIEDDEKFKVQEKREFEATKNSVLAKFETLTDKQKAAVVKAIEFPSGKMFEYKAAVLEINNILQPEWAEKERLKEQYAALKVKAADSLSPSSGQDTRLAGDFRIAEKIKEQIDGGKKGMVVVYGGSHTTHNQTLGGDIDSNLRKSGVPVLIVNVESPTAVEHCANSCKGIFDFFSMQRASRKWKEDVVRDNDPDRISVIFHPPAIVEEETPKLRRTEPAIVITPVN